MYNTTQLTHKVFCFAYNAEMFISLCDYLLVYLEGIVTLVHLSLKVKAKKCVLFLKIIFINLFLIFKYYKLVINFRH